MLKRSNTLIAERGLPETIDCGSPEIIADQLASIVGLVDQGVAAPNLPAHPPFEVHPYKALFPLQPFEKYIIGTFPPISYLLNDAQVIDAGITHLAQPVGVAGNLIGGPDIPFFHGNVGSMWRYFLTPLELAALLAIPDRVAARDFLIETLIQNRINYGDIVDNAQRELPAGRYLPNDDYLHNICVNTDLICHILDNPNAKYLLFNTATIFGVNGIDAQGGLVIINDQRTKSFDLFVRGCQDLGLTVEIRIQAGPPMQHFPWTNISHLNATQRVNKIAFELRISNRMNVESLRCSSLAPGQSKVLQCTTGPSPSRMALIALGANQVFIAWSHVNPGGTPTAFLKFIYQGFRTPAYLPPYHLNV